MKMKAMSVLLAAIAGMIFVVVPVFASHVNRESRERGCNAEPSAGSTQDQAATD